MNCPTLGAEVPEPCPRAPCDACRESLEERAGILQHGQGTGDPKRSEVMTCKTRSEADALARRQAVEAMPGQRRLMP
jgi:hypothetical protein